MKKLIALLFCLALLGVSGCDWFDSSTEPTSISLEGSCRPDTFRIECGDSTFTTPNNRMESITFILIDSSTGISVERKSVDPALDPPREVSFSGLESGTYEVEHVVRATTGEEARDVYANKVVP